MISFIYNFEPEMKGGGGGGVSPEQLAIQRQQLQIQQQQLALAQQNAQRQIEEAASNKKERARQERLDNKQATKDKLTNVKNIKAASGGVATSTAPARAGTNDSLLSNNDEEDLLGG